MILLCKSHSDYNPVWHREMTTCTGYQLYTGCYMNEGSAFTVLVNPHDNLRATRVISPNTGVAFPLSDG